MLLSYRRINFFKAISVPLLAIWLLSSLFFAEADFVGSALLRESINSSVGDDDKVYFFFTERNPELKPYSSQTRVARVARVCKVKTVITITAL